MAISSAALAARFCLELKEELDAESIANIVRRNKSNGFIGATACASHDFCDANQVMLNALSMMGVDFDAEDGEQAAWIDEAWTIARMLDFDEDKSFNASYLKEHEPNTASPKLKQIAGAKQTADLLLSDLMQANKCADALLSLHLLPLIEQARSIYDRLAAIHAAVAAKE